MYKQNYHIIYKSINANNRIGYTLFIENLAKVLDIECKTYELYTTNWLFFKTITYGIILKSHNQELIDLFTDTIQQ